MSTPVVNGSQLGSALQELLQAPDIEPGATPSYQLCKTIYLYHPLGAKMAESPIKIAQSKKRTISITNSPEERVRKAFEDEWEALGADGYIFDLARTCRIYGIASLAVDVDGKPTDQPIEYEKLADQKIIFKVFDPLNTAGSLVLDQNTDSPNFMKPADITVNGRTYHRSRQCVMMNERPIYIAYTTSAFGFVGRSVYQRALFPMKTFLQTMITDDLVSIKVGVLVAKMDQPGSVIDNVMLKLFGFKRQMLKDAATGNVLSIAKDEDIESLNLQNLDGPHKLSRENCLKNIATSADMPAVMLENETLTEGFGEGTEDAKMIAKYVEGIQAWLTPAYKFFDKITMYRAWTKAFYKTIQADFPEEYGAVSYEEAFYQWKNSFVATWPNLLAEPESKEQEKDKTKLEGIDKVLTAIAAVFSTPAIDPINKAALVVWAQDNINESRSMFKIPLQLDLEALAAYEPPIPDAGEDDEEDGAEPKADSQKRLRIA